MSKIRVAVLRGGPSHEYDVSLKTGSFVLSLLRDKRDKYEPHDIYISKTGAWHREGLSKHPEQALEGIDVVWNALHTPRDDSGMAQELLEQMGLPFTGSYSVSSLFAEDKTKTKHVFLENKLLTPRHEILESDDYSRLILVFQNFLMPVVVKPANGGSSIGARIARTFDELKEAVKDAFSRSKKVLVEEYIRGREATCGVVEDARGQEHYVLLPLEVHKPEGKQIFDYDLKCTSGLNHMCPGNFSKDEMKKIEDMTRRAHKSLGLRHYSRSDFVVTPRGNIYILETNNTPSLHEDSLMTKKLLSVGWHPRDFVDHCVDLALK